MRKSSFDKTFRASSLFSVLFILLLVVCVTAGTYFVSGKLTKDYSSETSDEEETDDGSDDGESDGGIFNSKAEKGKYSDFDYSQFDDIEEGQFVYVVNRSIYLKDGKSPANILLINPEQNSFFISLDIEVDDVNVYSSGIIKLNSYLERDVFSKSLDPGTYDAIGTITAYDAATAEAVETYETELTITVGE